jgi:hypothetical protein
MYRLAPGLVSIAALLLFASCVTAQLPQGPVQTEGMNPGECSDGADNDGDGDYDCNDSDCAGAPDCQGDDDDVADDDDVVDDDDVADDDDAVADDDDAATDDDDAGPDDDDSAGDDDDSADDGCLPPVGEVAVPCPSGALLVTDNGTNSTATSPQELLVTSETDICITGTITCDGADSDFYFLGSGLATSFQLDFSLDWVDSTGTGEMTTLLVETPYATGFEVFDGGCETGPPENQTTGYVFLPSGGLYYPSFSNGYDIIIGCSASSPIATPISYELVITGS